MAENFLTTSETAEILGVSARTVLNYINKGKLSSSKDDSGTNVIDKSELFRVFPKAMSKSTDGNSTKQAESFPNSDINFKSEIELLETKLLASEEKNQNLSEQLERSFKDNEDIKSMWKQSMYLLEDKHKKTQKRKRFLGIF